MSLNFRRDGAEDYIHTDISLNCRNIGILMDNLGFSLGPEGWDGTIAEFEAALRQFSPEFVDGGRETVQEGNWIDCGLRPGYLEERVGQLLEEVEKAKAEWMTHVYWC